MTAKLISLSLNPVRRGKVGPQPRPVADRFWKYVDKRGLDECWPWVGARDTSGYGILLVDRKARKAHRISWVISGKELPEYAGNDPIGILHRCDNRLCCNPAHLFLGTNLTNIVDKVLKGRASRKAILANPKLTAAQVGGIRALLPTGLSHRKIGQLFGVSRSNIGLIANGKTWVKPEILQWKQN
jgi:hypothetical protein